MSRETKEPLTEEGLEECRNWVTNDKELIDFILKDVALAYDDRPEEISNNTN